MMNTHLPLAQLGRMPEAWNIVARCREVFEAGENWSAYADATGALGELEFQRGHREPAIRLVLDAQRLARRDGSVATLARSYLALSRYEAAAGRAERALSRAVAGVMLARFGDDSVLAEAGRALLVDMMQEWPDIPLPAMADAEVAEDIHRNSNSVDPADLFTSVVTDVYQRSVEGSAGQTAADTQRRTRRASLRGLWRRTRKRW